MTVDHTGTASAPVAHGPRVLIFPEENAVARALARRIAAAVEVNPAIVLGLPPGRTPLALYRELGALHAAGADFSQVTTFNLDEFLGVPPSHPGSYRSFMETHLFQYVNIPSAQHNFLDGAAPDPEAECARYEHAIAEAGGIDLQISGSERTGTSDSTSRRANYRLGRIGSRSSRRRGGAMPLFLVGTPSRSRRKHCRWEWRGLCAPAQSSSWPPGPGRPPVSNWWSMDR